ncbi:ZIP family metal transporter [Candidatus Woesearchaeota archaeon]|nr:ZIP family metal transporter [Candidatus Woesearchaeota archaeon]MBW3016796.1 ZIP family metal transporter [Candidatus Woesearchaeota archaeon]
MSTLLWILLATFVNSLIGLVGAFTLGLKEKTLDKIIFLLVAFSAGALLGGAFFHLLPEAIEALEAMTAIYITIAGFIVFFIVEKWLFWHHCHKGACDIHPYSYLILIGDSVHNFIDGLVIAASFFVNPVFGIITTLVIMSHEIPQELGDFGILVHGGFKKAKALLSNFFVQTTCILGGIVGFILGGATQFSTYLLPFAAGGFIYISASDLIPELHNEKVLKKSIQSFLVFIIGLAFMVAVKLLFG